MNLRPPAPQIYLGLSTFLIPFNPLSGLALAYSGLRDLFQRIGNFGVQKVHTRADRMTRRHLTRSSPNGPSPPAPTTAAREVPETKISEVVRCRRRCRKHSVVLGTCEGAVCVRGRAEFSLACIQSAKRGAVPYGTGRLRRFAVLGVRLFFVRGMRFNHNEFYHIPNRRTTKIIHE